MKEKIKSIFSEYYLEIIFLTIALILVLINKNKAYIGIKYALNTYKNLFFVIVGVALISGLISELVNEKIIRKYIGKESGFMGVIIGAIFGTVMVGPAYIYYPFLNELINKGAKINIIATTIGAWAIKLQWLPFAITILGAKFIITLNIFIFIFAILSGYIVEYFVENTNYKKDKF
ncbi:MAG: hypothetical protein H5U37_03825 [Caldisericia bacterium]|nr:hypothetical protein [Caldisericia bacterium]